MSIILASGSPRRRELLEQAGVAFEVMASPAKEVHDAAMDPEALCELNARLKAEAVASQYPESLVIGSDTLVFIDGEPLGKPAGMDEAREMLSKLSGRTHQVCTAVCVVRPGGQLDIFHENTAVTFKELSDADIDGYFAVANPLDKAGGYGIQEHGELIVERIDGAFDNVMGLPVAKVLEALG